MAMDADSFSLMLADPADFEGRFGKLRRHALYLCAANYREVMGNSHRTRADLKAIIRPKLKAYAKQEYGSIVLAYILLTVLGAAISFAVEKFLSWLWDKKGGYRPNRERLEIARAIRLREQQQ